MLRCRIVQVLALGLLMACGDDDNDGAWDGSSKTPRETTDGTNPTDTTDDTGEPGTPTLPPIPATCVDVVWEPIIPADPWVHEDIDNGRTIHYIPNPPRALVIGLHGGGGNVDLMTQLHQTRLWNLLNETHVGFLLVESQIPGSWPTSTDASSPDYLHVAAVRDELIATTVLSEDTPIIVLGYSLGTWFAADLSEAAADEGWPVLGVILHNEGPRDVEGSFPAMFIGAENDPHDVVGGVERHTADGGTNIFIEGKERPWTNQEMLLHPDYDTTDAQEVFDDLVNLGFIDAQGVRIPPLLDIDALMDTYHATSKVPGPMRVTPLLRVAWADHRVTSEFACEERAFILNLLGL